ncbi:unnamed protein product [Boreogadus saida]
MAAVRDTILPPAAQPAGEVQTAPASAIPFALMALLPAALPAHLTVQPPSVSGAPLAAVPFLLNSRFLPLRPVHFRVVALAVHLRAQICRDPHRNRGNVLGSFTAADQSIVCWSHGAWWLSPPATPILFTPLPR